MSETEINGSVADKEPVVLPKPASEFLDEARIELKLRLQFRQEYENLFKIWKNDELAELQTKQDEIITAGLKKYFEEWQLQQKPPEAIDIQKLLDQEYETFTMPVDCVNYDEQGNESVEKITFTIRELPQSIEKKFYFQFRGKLVGKLQHMEALTQSGIDKTFEEKAKAFLELFDESFDMLAEAVLLCINPFGKRKGIDKAWVQDNIGSDRQWRIIEAQMKVNRLRDFFSKVSTSGQNMMTMRRPNFQALQTLVA